MSLSIFDRFKVGIGPSSSHTVGPMWAAHRFLLELDSRKLFDRIAEVRADLYGSLALTGKGHATDVAVMLGLSGERPDRIDPNIVDDLIEGIRRNGRLRLAGQTEVPFVENEQLVFHFMESLPKHPNGICLRALDAAGEVLFEERYEVRPDGSQRKNYYVKESCGIAAGMFITALHTMGLVTLTHTPSPMAFLTKVLGRPENERPFVMFPIGYPLPGVQVPDLARKRLDEVFVIVGEESEGG